VWKLLLRLLRGPAAEKYWRYRMNNYVHPATLEFPGLSSHSDDGPWAALEAHGEGLSVENFLTTWMSHVSNALRRAITVPYADEFGLTVAEWRMISVLAHAETLPFGELVMRSSTDKSLVSRTMRMLEGKGLVSLQAQGNAPRRKLICQLTPVGVELHDRVIPKAREGQAKMLLVMTVDERKVLFQVLQKLHRECLVHEAALHPHGVPEEDLSHLPSEPHEPDSGHVPLN